MEKHLESKVAVLTGAGGGIGQAAAVKLAQNKMKVVLLGGHNKDKLDLTRRAVE